MSDRSVIEVDCGGCGCLKECFIVLNLVLIGAIFLICSLMSSLDKANERLEKIEQKIELKSK